MSSRKKLYFSTAAAGFLFFTGCADNNEAGQTADLNEETAADEELTGELEEAEDRIQELEDEIRSLQDENLNLKDDVLTYKQQVIDQSQEFEQEQQLRNHLQELARDFFHAMHERNIEELDELTGEDLIIEEEEEIFRMGEDKNGRSFHFMKLDRMNFVFQRSITTGEEDALAEYEFYSAEEESISRIGMVELMFGAEEDEWKVTSIEYIN